MQKKQTRLSQIAISHISLVKEGANGKQIIYKSAKEEPTYTKEIKIAKSDGERGVIYGIVYSPDEVDSQGDTASSDEIQKAAYLFMKERNTLNVDKNHDFVNKDAFIAESWIVRKGDPVFPDETKGAWAVAVQLESEELKEAVKKGEIAGLSMAGTAHKEEVAKATKQETKKVLGSLLEAFKNLSVSINGYIEKEKKEKDLAKDKKEIEQIVESTAIIQKAYEEVHKENKELKEENTSLAKRVTDVEEALKKSKQDENPKNEEKENTTGGFL